jgi:hypothetical protein
LEFPVFEVHLASRLNDGDGMKKILFAFLFISSLHAQTGFELPGTRFDPSIPTPRSILGYNIGDQFTDYASLNSYIDELVWSTDRAKREVYGMTSEHRFLQALIISTPENLARLEEFRANNLKLTDPRSLRSKDEAAKIISTIPVIVYLSYGVHGNEASSPEAAMLVAYQLCAGTEERTLSILRNAIVIIDPNVNPDGRERYVQWVNSSLGVKPNLSPSSFEHSEPWPGGRTNHYFFDLNRDLSWQTQRETQARVKFYRQWMPHVHVDYHEMEYSSTYFFFPAAVPFHQTLPAEVVKWGKIFGQGNAAAFDERGIPYYVGERFDMFYPGYGDSWPTFNGATGMTYEQAGGSRAALAVRQPSGRILSLRDRARNHFITSISTLETSVKMKKERLEDFYKFWDSALKPSQTVKGYLLGEQPDPGRTSTVVATLLRQGIEVYQLTESSSLMVQEYFSKSWANQKLPKGTYFIPMAQPQSRLMQTLLEPTTAVSDTFFYDVSAWSLPVASGLKSWVTQSPLPSSALKVDAPTSLTGRVIGDETRSFAFLIPWERNAAIPLVWQLLEKGYSLSVARRPFETLGRHFTAGTVVAFSGMNNDSLKRDIGTLSQQYGIDVYASPTGLTDRGVSLGSSYIAPLKKSSIAIAEGPPVASNDFGELWFLFEQELGIPFSAIRATELGDIDLSKFDVLILPDAGNYQSVFDSSRVDKLRRWMQNGGVLIGIEGGAQFMAKSKSGLTGAVFKSEKKEEEKSKEEKDQEKARKEQSKRMTLFEKEERSRLDRIPGTIFRVLIDTTHPSGFGVQRELYVFKGNAAPIELSDVGHTVARFAGDSVQVSGYSPKERAQKVAEAAFIQEYRVGRGRALLFAESVTFRRFWSGLQKLLLNSILFLPQPD